MMRIVSEGRITAVVVALFVVSGATALVGEVVWMRMLGLVMGNTVWAASIAVAAWMGGMALGAALGAGLASRTRRHLWWYALAEGGIGVFYALSPTIVRGLLVVGATFGDDLGGRLAIGVLQRLLLAAVALLIPTTLMGLTLPLLVERLRGSALARRVGLLYGANTLGAAAGVFGAAYLLLPRLGEQGSLAMAAVACSLVAMVAVWLDHLLPRLGGTPAGSGPRPTLQNSRFLVLVALMGCGALAAELIWVRILVLHLGSRVYAFALLLGVYLTGLALGSLVMRLVPSPARPVRVLEALQLAVAVLLGAQLLALGHFADLMAWLTDVLRPPATFAGLQGVMIASVAALFLPITVLFGASFPLAVAADPARRSDGAHVGRVAAANTLGAIVGALGAPFILIPTIGSQRGLLVLALIFTVVAVGLVRSRRVMIAAGLVVAGVVVIWTTLPPDWVLRQVGYVDVAQGELLELEEGIGATLTIARYPDRRGEMRVLELNGVNVAGTKPELRIVQQLQGNLPLLQVAEPRRVLHVGFGSGGTCWAVSRHPVEAIDVVEISPEVPRASARWFPEINRGVLADPRVRVIVNDGRNFLLATDRRYDAILSDSIHPLFAGNSTLYTRDYFDLCRSHVRPGGVVSMWLPLYSLDQASLLRILRAFWEVFPRTAVWYDVSTVNENTIVTGLVEPGPLRIDWQRLTNPDLEETLREGGIDSAEALMADLLLGPSDVAQMVAGVPPLRDDLPFVEYNSGRLLSRNAPWLANLTMLAAHRAQVSPFSHPPVEWDQAKARRDRELDRRISELADLVSASTR